MKCKVCGGTGTSNTCVNGTFKPCTFCDGTGEYEPFDADVELDKLYPTEQTNEEWFCQLPTDKKAEFMGDIWGRGYLKGHFDGNFEFGEKQDKAYWEMWLKQPHTEK